MVLTKQEKIQLVKDLIQKLQKEKTFLITNFHGLSSKDANELRLRLFDKGIEYRAIKKSLIAKAFQQAQLEDFDIKKAEGQIALAWGEDGIDLVKTVSQFAKEKKLDDMLVAGFLNGTFLPKEKVVALSKLPSIETLRAQLVGVLRGSLVGLMNVLNGNQRKLVFVLKAIADAKA